MLIDCVEWLKIGNYMDLVEISFSFIFFVLHFEMSAFDELQNEWETKCTIVLHLKFERNKKTNKQEKKNLMRENTWRKWNLSYRLY